MTTGAVGGLIRGAESIPKHPMFHDDGSDLIFIVGHYKSGSTWLINLLSLHPEIRGVGETSIFPYVRNNDDLRVASRRLFTEGFWGRGGLLRQVRHRLAECVRPVRSRWKPTLPAEDRPTLLMDLGIFDQLALRRSLDRSTSKEDYCRRFFGFLHRTLCPRGYLVEKNNNIDLVPFIRSIFPAAKLMAIHRDGRDVVVSEKYYLRNEEGRSKPFRESALGWRQAMEQQFRYEREHGILAISYESLLTDSRSVTRDLLGYLGLPTGDEVVDEMVHKSSFKFVTGRKDGREKRSSFYRKGTAGDWKNHFSEDDKAVFKGIAGDVLVRLGYERDLDW